MAMASDARHSAMVKKSLTPNPEPFTANICAIQVRELSLLPAHACIRQCLSARRFQFAIISITNHFRDPCTREIHSFVEGALNHAAPVSSA
jgi:hypothetical protein